MKRPLSRQRVAKMREREAAVGVDPDDEAARWLAENEPSPAPDQPKAARKSKLLHQFRNKTRDSRLP